MADNTAQSLDEVEQTIQNNVEFMGEIVANSQQQAEGSTMMEQKIQEIGTVSQNNVSISQETAGTSKQLHQHAMELHAMLNKFKKAKGSPKNLQKQKKASMSEEDAQLKALIGNIHSELVSLQK